MIPSMQLALAKLSAVLLLVQIAYATGSPAIYPIEPDQAQPQRPNSAQIFAQVPLLRLSASCESTGDINANPRQFLPNGDILWGQEKSPTGTIVIVKRDCGAEQINTKVHGRYPNGLDVCGNYEDNIYYAYLLWQQSGMMPWSQSEGCWGKEVHN